MACKSSTVGRIGEVEFHQQSPFQASEKAFRRRRAAQTGLQCAAQLGTIRARPSKCALQPSSGQSNPSKNSNCESQRSLTRSPSELQVHAGQTRCWCARSEWLELRNGI